MFTTKIEFNETLLVILIRTVVNEIFKIKSYCPFFLPLTCNDSENAKLKLAEINLQKYNVFAFCSA